MLPLLSQYSQSHGLSFDAKLEGDSVVLNGTKFEKLSCSSLMRYYGRFVSSGVLYSNDPLECAEIDSWLTIADDIAEGKLTNFEAVDKRISTLTYLVGHRFTVADVSLANALYFCKVDIEKFTHIKRWQKLMMTEISMPTNLPQMKSGASVEGSPKKKAKQEDVGKFVDLPGAEMGKVVVRFPPEASGYLHVGHAKAALVNQYYQQTFQGKLILRFDDTNPAKENEHFENVIRKDLEMLEVKPDCETRTSDYFDVMLDLCEKMIKDANAYADDTDADTMKKEREARTESKNRSNSVEKNLAMWREMVKGTDYGQQCCIRAKVDMNSNNGCMRDPTLYRCKNESHVATGDKYKAYPTYDFACPIVDSIEGVTHALRTTEYHDRDEQYYWLIEKLQLRKPYIWEYARLNLQNTVLSKRKLTWLVNQGVVDSWEDPRFPTVRGILRHGMTVQGLKDFIAAQGGSKSIVQMEWDKIWAFNKKIIDPIAPRYTALSEEKLVPVTLSGIDCEEMKEQQLHPKNKEVGTKQVAYCKVILIEQQDAVLLKEDESVTLINWGNCIIKKIERSDDGNEVTSIQGQLNLEDTNFKATKHKLTWLPEKHSQVNSIPIIARTYSHLISKPVLGKDEEMKDFVNWDSLKEENLLGDHNMASVKLRDIIQIQRKGFFICDRPYEPFNPVIGKDLPAIFIYIPDGHKSQEDQEKQQVQVTSKSSKQNKELNDSKKQKQNPKTAESGDSKSNQSLDLTAVRKLFESISAQGDEVRKLKTEKKPQEEVKPAVDRLLALKVEFKAMTGIDHSPKAMEKLSAGGVEGSENQEKPKEKEAKKQKDNKTVELGDTNLVKNIDLTAVKKLVDSITEQGNLVRELKTAKKPQDEVKPAVDKLLALKAEFKTLTGSDYNPQVAEKLLASKAETTQSNNTDVNIDDLDQKISAQGEKIRALKAQKASKDEVQPEVNILLELKTQFKNSTGNDWKPKAAAGGDGGDKKSTPAKEHDKENAKGSKKQEKKKGQDKPKEKQQGGNDGDGGDGGYKKKETKLGLGITMEDNYSEWYTQVITKAEMIEYYDVSGCYVLRPLSYAIWEKIQSFFDGEIKKLDVENVYFPMFVSKSALEREKDHIADFAPEVAWVTRSGKSELAEPIAIRPTSETVMYPSYAKWIQSHRDLPLKLNQWNNVVRWEFKNPTPFLRTREFLWQEGHTAFATREEAVEEVHAILDLYARVYEELLAIPVIKGRKTEKEKFPGADFTTTVEAFISQCGRGIQGATSHHLGQNFSKMFNIVFENPDKPGEQCFAHQNSWGLSTRTIGTMVMAHSDNKGLVLPPKVAHFKLVVVPCGITDQTNEKELFDNCSKMCQELNDHGLKAKTDLRPNYSPGWKFNHWELKGVPIRVEIGPKDLQKGQVTMVRRDTGERSFVKRDQVITAVEEMLDVIQKNLLERAKTNLSTHLKVTKSFDEFCSLLDQKNILLAPFCGDKDCEGEIKEESAKGRDLDANAPSMGAKSLCIPFEQPEGEDVTKCACIKPGCKNAPKKFTLFGRSY